MAWYNCTASSSVFHHPRTATAESTILTAMQCSSMQCRSFDLLSLARRYLYSCRRWFAFDPNPFRPPQPLTEIIDISNCDQMGKKRRINNNNSLVNSKTTETQNGGRKAKQDDPVILSIILPVRYGGAPRSIKITLRFLDDEGQIN